MAGKKAGRPKKEISFEEFKKLCHIQCTLDEIASWFECSDRTIENWCKRELGMNFFEAFKRYSEGGKISIRRNQFKLSETNASMAMWLGKLYLGQRDPDKRITVLDGTDDESVQAMMAYFRKKKEAEGNEE